MSGAKRVLRSTPYEDEEGGDALEFRLTYEGPLRASNEGKEQKPERAVTMAKHKHDIRREFHPQLRALWGSHPFLQSLQKPKSGSGGENGPSFLEELAANYPLGGFRFAPLVFVSAELLCELDILFLRPGAPGTLISSGDIDNRLKTLFDALRRPDGIAELGGAQPQPGDDPFFVLLQDDKLITRISVETDRLLQPVRDPANDLDVRLVITVRLRPIHGTWLNLGFL